jgi:dephospho-CoA kinase
MSWSEYKVLKEKYGDAFKVLAIMASPAVRYTRLSSRGERHGEDKEKKFRSFTLEESRSRDYSEIENLEKGGPVVMADYTIINEVSLDDFQNAVRNIVQTISTR